MSSDQTARVVTLPDLAQLTLRANVAFAVRCAQRLRPCFQLPASTPRRREQIAAVDNAIRIAIAYCQGDPVQAGGAAAAARAAAVVAEDTCEFTSFAGYAAVRAAEAAACAEAFTLNPDEAAATEVVAAAFGAGRVVAANADAFAQYQVVFALHNDMQKLRNEEHGSLEDLGPPVDLSESGPLGPLWPGGAPMCFSPDAQEMPE
jgi:hypothetical protein